MGKNGPQNSLEWKFVHQNQTLCTIDPLTPHNATPNSNPVSYWGTYRKAFGKFKAVVHSSFTESI